MDKRDERAAQLLKTVGNALETARSAFALLVDELLEEDEPEEIADDNPAICQHPQSQRLRVLDQEMCNACGSSLV